MYNSKKKKNTSSIHPFLEKHKYKIIIGSVIVLFLVYLRISYEEDITSYDSRRKKNQRSSEKEHTQDFADYDDYNEKFHDSSDSSSTSSSSEEIEDEEMVRMGGVMEIRRDWAYNKCQALNEDLDGEPNGWEYLINYDHQLIWCNVFKAASTTWFRNFMILADHEDDYEDEVPVSAARMVYHRPTGEELKEAHRDPESIAFIIVRHPFERLSSAYRDKIQNRIPGTPYGDLAKDIVSKYRKKQAKDQDKKTSHHSVPTFEEFVRYVLDEASQNNTLDMHWVSYSKFCTPCQMHFDVIVRFETYDEDVNYLLQLTDLHDVLPSQRLNAGSDKRVNKGKDTKEMLKDYFSQLTVRQVTQLYELYKHDFEIFNYSAENFYNMAKS